VRNADLVVLSLPLDQIRETMEIIAQDLQEDCVIMDTGPNKEAVETWAAEFLPPKRHYVGLTPVINPAYLHTADSGAVAARADLFRGGLMAIVAPARTESGAIKLASDLTRLLGATPLFADPIEMDGLMAATHLLPQLMAAGLLNATIDQPGWREGRKIAGKAYAEATGPIVHLDNAHALQEAVILNRENVLRVLDGTLAALQAIRGDIEARNAQALDERLLRARRGREKWWAEREAGDWMSDEVPPVDMSGDPGFLGRLFGAGKKSKK
jgi:prephenate dehydrogenase